MGENWSVHLRSTKHKSWNAFYIFNNKYVLIKTRRFQWQTLVSKYVPQFCFREQHDFSLTAQIVALKKHEYDCCPKDVLWLVRHAQSCYLKMQKIPSPGIWPGGTSSRTSNTTIEKDWVPNLDKATAMTIVQVHLIILYQACSPLGEHTTDWIYNSRTHSATAPCIKRLPIFDTNRLVAFHGRMKDNLFRQ